MTDVSSGTQAAAPLAGEILSLIRTGRASTRAELAEISGLSRPTITSRVEALMRAGYVIGAETTTARGRPPTSLVFNYRGGFLLAADIGGTHTRTAVTDLAGNVLEEREADLDVADGPGPVLGWVRQAFGDLVRAVAGTAAQVRGVGIGVPGPVDHDGRLVSPPIMPGWDGYAVPEFFGDAYDAHVVVDRDVNIIALGEHRRSWREYDDIAVVKYGLGIGMGLILRGEPYRGALGAAGELGHLPRGGDVPCRCGRTGCLEAVAGGWAIRHRLQESGRDVRTSADIVALAHRGDPEALRLLREAGGVLGEAVADVVSLLNPAVLVIGGNLAEVQEPLLPAVRQAIYARCPSLSTRDLRIAPSRLGSRAGTIGAALLAHEHVFAPDRISAELGL